MEVAARIAVVVVVSSSKCPPLIHAYSRIHREQRPPLPLLCFEGSRVSARRLDSKTRETAVDDEIRAMALVRLCPLIFFILMPDAANEWPAAPESRSV